MRQFLFFILTLSISFIGFAQSINPAAGVFFNDGTVPRIDILIAPSHLEQILQDGNEWSNEEFPISFVFNDGLTIDTVLNAGFRLRGNTSREAIKKSFKISINAFEKGKKYRGLEKINLNGSHNDPSISRVKVAWDLAQQMNIPAPRSNYIILFINGAYFGIYSNVEHIDENFVAKRFGNNDGNLYKCLWPARLEYLGVPSNYKFTSSGRRAYELKTNNYYDDYSDLAHFIDVLNNTALENLSCELEKVFNVDAYLKAIAFEILIGHWDNYIFNKNNFYLYQNQATQQFEYIPFDVDNTLGLNWLAPNFNFSNRNIYDWESPNSNRPAYQRILEIEAYRDRLTYYLEESMLEHLDEDTMLQRLFELQTLIQFYVDQDPLYPQDYGYNLNDYIAAFAGPNSSFWYIPHSIFEFIKARKISAAQQMETYDLAPILSHLKAKQVPVDNDIPVNISANTNSALSNIELFYQINGNDWQVLNMLDDGQATDTLAGDHVYSCTIAGQAGGSQVNYYAMAEDTAANSTTYPSCGFKTLVVGESSEITLRINEVMSSNQYTIEDESGQYPDWIELYNYGTQNVPLAGKYLTDNIDLPTKWAMPNVNIFPGEYYLFWADKDVEEGIFHTNFQIDQSAEHLAIFNDRDSAYTLIDAVYFNDIPTDESYGRLPNGTGDWQLLRPSPRASNEDGQTVAMPTNELFIYPNPATNLFQVEKNDISGTYQLSIEDLTGRILIKEIISIDEKLRYEVDASLWAKGLYFVSLKRDNKIFEHAKFIKI